MLNKDRDRQLDIEKRKENELLQELTLLKLVLSPKVFSN